MERATVLRIRMYSVLCSTAEDINKFVLEGFRSLGRGFRFPSPSLLYLYGVHPDCVSKAQ